MICARLANKEFGPVSERGAMTRLYRDDESILVICDQANIFDTPDHYCNQ